MKILVTGATGQLGHDVCEGLHEMGFMVFAPTRSEMDLTSETAVRSYCESTLPDAIVHCAAWTNVDLAEEKTEECRKCNVLGTEYITKQCIKQDIPLLYISTDYVFDGNKDGIWETNDTTCPIGQYGLSKRDGEDVVKKHNKHFILRISWVYGINGKNFVKTMINLSKKLDMIRVVSDQFGSPTYTSDLVPLIISMIQTNKYGTYQAHNEGFCSWYEFSEEIMKLIGSETRIVPISTEEYPTKAKRPKNSKMSTASLTSNGFELLPPWEEGLSRFIEQYKDELISE